MKRDKNLFNKKKVLFLNLLFCSNLNFLHKNVNKKLKKKVEKSIQLYLNCSKALLSFFTYIQKKPLN